MPDSDETIIQDALNASSQTKLDMIQNCSQDLIAAAAKIADAMRRGNKLMLCGNGGSAADCQHIATEFVVRLTSPLWRRALPALALTTDTSTLTAQSNDKRDGFDYIFSRQIEALGQPGDVLLVISTSGGSKNILSAIECARKKAIMVIAFIGKQRKEWEKPEDTCIHIPSSDSQRVQEGHITAGHLLVTLVEKKLLEAGYITFEKE